MDVHAAFQEHTVFHDIGLQGDIGFDAFDYHFREGGSHARDGYVPVLSMSDQLADHGIIVGRHSVSIVDMAVKTNARAAGDMQLGDGAGAGHEINRVFRVDATFYGMSADFYVLLLAGQLSAGR